MTDDTKVLVGSLVFGVLGFLLLLKIEAWAIAVLKANL